MIHVGLLISAFLFHSRNHQPIQSAVFSCSANKPGFLLWAHALGFDSNNCIWVPHPQVITSVRPQLNMGYFLLPPSADLQPRHHALEAVMTDLEQRQAICTKMCSGLWHRNEATKCSCWCHSVAGDKLFYRQWQLSGQSAKGIAVFLNHWTRKQAFDRIITISSQYQQKRIPALMKLS